MATTDQDIIPKPETEGAPQAAPDKPEAARIPVEPGKYATWAVISILLSVAAWITGIWNGYVALAISIVSIVCGAVALRSRRHPVRNTAITAIIASAVLAVVIVAFIIVIYLGLKSM